MVGEFPKYIRVNTSSLKVATFTKNYLEKKLKYPFSYGVSSRNILMLDFDCPDKPRDCLDEAIALCKALTNEYGSECCIYETPNGYHLIFYRFLRWSTVKRILRMLLYQPFCYLDTAHIEASLRRGYITLRLNHIRIRYCISNNVERWY